MRAFLLYQLNNEFIAIASQIEEQAFAVLDNFLPTPTLLKLLEETNELFNDGEFHLAKIGKGIEEQRIAEVRSDKIHWLEKKELTESQREYWHKIEELQNYLSEYFRQSLIWFECHLAIYPIGSFYLKHLDQFRETSNRIISFILYLNEDWKVEDGGALRIHTKDGYQDIYPEMGRFACFRSDLVEHEVLHTNRERYSITGWMRRDEVPLIITDS